MTYPYRGYTIDYDRNHADAWRGEQSNRMPDVQGHDLADAMYKINRILDDEHKAATDETRHADPIVEI